MAPTPDPATMLLAAAKGDAHAVAAWLDEGGAVEMRCPECSDMTMLIAAASQGQDATVRMLLQRGASVNLQSFIGITALMAAANNGHTTTVQALLDAKADASLQTKGGRTALMWAEQEKHTATARLLRQHAKRLASAKAEARADAAATRLLAEAAAEKELQAAANKINGKKIVDQEDLVREETLPFAAAADPVAAVQLADASKPTAAEEELPAIVFDAAGGGVMHRLLLRGRTMAAAWTYAAQRMMRWLRPYWRLPGNAALSILIAMVGARPKPASVEAGLPEFVRRAADEGDAQANLQVSRANPNPNS